MTAGAQAAARSVSCSIVIEWDNARLSELSRSRRMLESLAAQVAALDPARLELRQVLVLWDRGAVRRELIEGVLAGTLAPLLGAERLRLLDTDGLQYYQLKNLGARTCEGEVVVFLDSDVVPEEGWLERLVEPFGDSRVDVVAGSSYIEPEGYFSRTMALWWFFPLRDARAGIGRVGRFWANNVAFRRRLFLAGAFPELPTFRGQCVALARSLEKQGVPIMQRVDARVAHPAPNGWRHFVCHAMAEGYDRVVLLDMHRQPTGAWRASWRRFASSLRDARARIRDKRAALGVGPLGAAGAFALALLYYGLNFAGERISLRWPWVIRRYFPI